MSTTFVELAVYCVILYTTLLSVSRVCTSISIGIRVANGTSLSSHCALTHGCVLFAARLPDIRGFFDVCVSRTDW